MKEGLLGALCCFVLAAFGFIFEGIWTFWPQSIYVATSVVLVILGILFLKEALWQRRHK